jgi:hypothetical protein
MPLEPRATRSGSRTASEPTTTRVRTGIEHAPHVVIAAHAAAGLHLQAVDPLRCAQQAASA